ncbi:MAG: tRNA 2-thiouridine(34) synthase MnmA [Erysipelotrichaceae bacterium]|nr:tRNA 2-thiouridine(34) synthase MnmA [Erysipelotrichaceae bacterium]MDY5251835.1 tRNA 2-thiouridine(34) synthase MnmA [Erysipelotrichaceae bacterium]
MKVLVGLSGGVDSAIAAYLLKEQGHDVTCCFMRNWDSMANNDFLGNPTIEDDVCPQEKDYMDAKSVADSLGLELLRIDFVKEYWDHVFASFLNEYKKGRTPNPDILCNKYIKFDSFLKFAKEKGFDAIATGHYAKKTWLNDKPVMQKAHDLNKDQTYFLCQISKEALSYTLFPLGDIDKPQVREYAQKLELSIAKKKDSTGICFIGERNFRAFLQNYLPSKPGNIIDIDTKKVLKQHQGVLFYTIGQRKGLDIGGAGGPWFVVGKDVVKNELYVASGDDNAWLLSTSCIVSDVNWLYDVDDQIECMAKFRYRQMDNPVTLEKIDDTHVKLTYLQGVKAVTCGQEAVFYLNDICLGGGIIDQVYYQGITMEERLEAKLKG